MRRHRRSIGPGRDPWHVGPSWQHGTLGWKEDRAGLKEPIGMYGFISIQEQLPWTRNKILATSGEVLLKWGKKKKIPYLLETSPYNNNKGSLPPLTSRL